MTVPRGGWLFEYYLLAHASFSVHRDYKRYLRILSSNQPDETELSNLFESIISSCSTRFVGWIMISMNGHGTNGGLQIFYLTFLDHYFGLSRQGITINSKYGFGIPLTAFDSRRKVEINRSLEQTKSKMDGPHVLWYDNFSKFRAHSIPTVKKNVFSECLWTGVSVNEYPEPDMDMKLRFDDNNNLIHAMPSDIFECKHAVHSGIMTMYAEGSGYFERSIAKKYNVNNVPLKIDIQRFPEMKDTMNSPKNTTKYVHPYKLLNKNIGSNIGLINILRDLQLEHDMDPVTGDGPHKYVVLNLDENIYWRVLKVCLIIFQCLHHVNSFPVFKNGKFFHTKIYCIIHYNKQYSGHV